MPETTLPPPAPPHLESPSFSWEHDRGLTSFDPTHAGIALSFRYPSGNSQFLPSQEHLLLILGPVFGSKDNFHGLAIFLDTYPNDETTEVGSCRAGRDLSLGPAWEQPPGIGVVGSLWPPTGWAALGVTAVLSQRVFPYISVMVNNGSLSYDHSKDGRWTELAGCTADFRNRDHDTFLAVRYSRGRLTVSRQEGRLCGAWEGRQAGSGPPLTCWLAAGDD